MKQQKGFSLIVMLCIVFGILALGFGSYWYYTSSNLTPENQNPIIGGTKDAHGCLPAAGYSWCEAKQTCIRPWEEYCTATPPKTVLFACADSKSIGASFYIGDDKYVDLNLSDGRKLSVPHAISASGARYANADESFVFWNKGDTAFVTENTSTTFTDCLIQTQ